MIVHIYPSAENSLCESIDYQL